jgi:hypothetical protein
MATKLFALVPKEVLNGCRGCREKAPDIINGYRLRWVISWTLRPHYPPDVTNLPAEPFWIQKQFIPCLELDPRHLSLYIDKLRARLPRNWGYSLLHNVAGPLWAPAAFQWVQRATSPEAKRREREADHWYPFSDELSTCGSMPPLRISSCHIA